jgi:hypothetical protein
VCTLKILYLFWSFLRLPLAYVTALLCYGLLRLTCLTVGVVYTEINTWAPEDRLFISVAMRTSSYIHSYWLAVKQLTKHIYIHLLKSTGYVMHQKVQHSTIERSAHIIFMCFVFI